MKKLILVLFLCLSCFSFGEWSVFNLVDEFGDETGSKTLVSDSSSYNGFFKVEKDSNNEYYVFINSSEYIGGKGQFDEAKVRIKVDNLSPLTFYGIVLSSSGGKMVAIKFNNADFTSFLNLLKKGNTMKIVIEKYNDTTILQKYDLTGFSKSFEKFDK